ncbi:hypothetical protein [Citreimonas sp.]|uniref:hypothetical protein n=1 Tax=Citreimonas sp. TaxID=3036715 RepID=UPI00405864D3
MAVKKQTKLQFSQRVGRISAASRYGGPRAQGAHRPVANALIGAFAALPLYAAAAPTFGPDAMQWLPAPLREEGMMLLAAALGASLALLSLHGPRLLIRRGAASRNSAAALAGACLAATALIVCAALPAPALADYAGTPLKAFKVAMTQIAQTIPGLDAGRL